MQLPFRMLLPTIRIIWLGSQQQLAALNAASHRSNDGKTFTPTSRIKFYCYLNMAENITRLATVYVSCAWYNIHYCWEHQDAGTCLHCELGQLLQFTAVRRLCIYHLLIAGNHTCYCMTYCRHLSLRPYHSSTSRCSSPATSAITF